MKLVYWLVPCLGVTAFAAYYHYWDNQPEVYFCPAIPRDPFAEYERRDGRRDAEADLAKGAPKFLSYGLPAHWIGEFGIVLARDYGVQKQTVAGCVVSDSLVKYVENYNRVVERHLSATYHTDVMAEAVRKAKALYNERHPPRAALDLPENAP